jgi:predicted aspartyl protease
VEELGLKFHKRGQAVLADGSTVVFDTYEAIILWNGRTRRIAIDAAEVDPLLGVRLLYGHELSVDFIENGDVVIQALPMS